jgi:hypothetical protein
MILHEETWGGFLWAAWWSVGMNWDTVVGRGREGNWKCMSLGTHRGALDCMVVHCNELEYGGERDLQLEMHWVAGAWTCVGFNWTAQWPRNGLGYGGRSGTGRPLEVHGGHLNWIGRR